MSILTEAIAEAEMVRTIAYENAQQAVRETFQPKIQRMISAKLAEEDAELDDDEILDEPNAPQSAEQVPQAQVPQAQVPQAPTAVDEFEPLPNDDDELEMEGYLNTIKELDSEDEDFIVPEDVVLEIEDLDLNDVGLDDVDEIRKPSNALKNEIAALRKENREAKQAILTLKTAMNEVNLLNAKLMYASKASKGFELTEKQQIKLLTSFDRAKSIREVKLLYAALCENYTAKTASKPSRPIVESITSSASKSVLTPKQSSVGNGQYEFAERWKTLANIKK